MRGTKRLVTAIIVSTLAYCLILPKRIRHGRLVETNSGAVLGSIATSRDGRDFYQWLGIPYAKPPIGELRFASPEPIGKWIGVHDGSKHGPLCLQNDFMLTNTIRGEEDCLFLNVHIPKHRFDNAKVVPVLFYVHAGAYTFGGSKEYTPEYFMDEDVLVVTINYRLDILGFLSTGDKVIRGNMGLKDQTLALKWINENIQYFGGDPNQITICGHSAGGASVNQLLLSPMTKGLFHKAISHSGAASNSWGFKSPAKSLEKTKSIAQTLGCPTHNSEELAQCLRSANIGDLMAAVFEGDKDMPLFQSNKFGDPVVPTIELVDDEDAFLTQHPLEVMAQGKAHRVPWMVGHTSDEGYLSTAALQDDDAMQKFEDNWDCHVKTVFAIDSIDNEATNEKAAKIHDFYFPPALRSSLSREKKLQIYSQLFGDSFFNFDIRESITYQRQFAPVYPYFYSKTTGPSFGQVALKLLSDSWTGKIEFALDVLKLIVSHYVFGMEPPEDSVSVHAVDMFVVFPVFHTISKSSKHYHFSRDYVKLVVDFAGAKDDTAVSFRGVTFPSTPQSGELKFFEITNETPRVITEPFRVRMEFLHGLKIRDYSANTV